MTAEAELARLQAEFDRLTELPESAREAELLVLAADEHELAEQLRCLLHSDAAFEANPGDAAPSMQAGQSGLPQVPGYQLLELVGRGGMGRVFRAFQCNDEQRVSRALKLLHGDTARPQLRERFEAECKVLADLDHPGIARYIASGFSEENGAPFVVMEFVEGEPIDRWCDQHQATLRERLELLRQLLAAVQHAHQRLIVHRDIKPGNILVDQQGRVVLVDFGIAKRICAELPADLTATDNRFLSVLSAAPEQLLGQAASTATDVYAIGLLMYRLLCGHDPFGQPDEGSQLRYQQRVLDLPAPAMASRLGAADQALARARGLSSVKELQRALRGDLNRIVLRCLRKAPEERYPDSSSLDRDLRAVLQGWPISERESEPVYRLRKFVGRHRSGVALAGVAVLLLGGLWWNAWVQRSRALHERDRAEAAITVLKQAFAAANPLGVAGGDVRVREVLNASRGQLEELRKQQPDVFATLSVTMAEVELSAGRPRQALQLTRAALQSLNQGLAEGLSRRLLQLQARAQLEGGEFDDLQPILEALPQLSLNDKIERKILLGRFAYLQSQLDAAIGHLQDANALSFELNEDHPLRFEARIFLAQALRLNEQPADAIEVLDQTLASLSRRFRPEHPRILLTQLRRIELQRGFATTEHLLAETNALSRRIELAFGARSAPYGRLLGLRAQLQQRAGLLAESVSSHESAWQAWAAATDAGHPNTLRALFNLAFWAGRAGRPTADVDALFSRLLKDASEGSELNSSIHNYWKVSYLEFLAKRKQCKSALALADSELVSQPNSAFNPPTLGLLADVVEGLQRDCGCLAQSASDACAVLPRFASLVKPAGEQVPGSP